MKLACIINLWDGEEHLKQAMSYVKDHVEEFIIIFQAQSNFGEYYDPFPNIAPFLGKMGRVYVQEYEPSFVGNENDGFENELAKREIGRSVALKHGCSHYFFMDADEFYPDFEKMKAEYIDRGLDGSVCGIETYVGKPEYKVTPPMKFHVPFITPVKYQLGGRQYYRCDRTRTARCISVDKIESGVMHHLSWIRNDLERKIRNSSARHQRDNDIIREEVKRLINQGPGFKSNYFHGRYYSEV